MHLRALQKIFIVVMLATAGRAAALEPAAPQPSAPVPAAPATATIPPVAPEASAPPALAPTPPAPPVPTQTLTAPIMTSEKPKYAQRGVLEAGGSVSFSHSSVTLDTTELTITNVSVSPEIGYFVAPNFELIAAASFGNERQTPQTGTETSTNSWGIAGGAGYFIPVGPVFLGPKAGLGYSSYETKDATGTLTISGLRVLADAVLKVPVGSGGVLELGVGFRYSPLNYNAVPINNGSKSFSGSTTRIGLELGYSVFF